MPKRQPLPLEPFLAWSSLGLRWMEMMSASSQTIARRSQHVPTPFGAFRMGSEKVQAAIDSTNAMARHWVDFPTSTGLEMWTAWAHLLDSGMAPYRSRAMRNARSPRRR